MARESWKKRSGDDDQRQVPSNQHCSEALERSRAGVTAHTSQRIPPSGRACWLVNSQGKELQDSILPQTRNRSRGGQPGTMVHRESRARVEWHSPRPANRHFRSETLEKKGGKLYFPTDPKGLWSKGRNRRAPPCATATARDACGWRAAAWPEHLCTYRGPPVSPAARAG